MADGFLGGVVDDGVEEWIRGFGFCGYGVLECGGRVVWAVEEVGPDMSVGGALDERIEIGSMGW